jgi:hypothetical protein
VLNGDNFAKIRLQSEPKPTFDKRERRWISVGWPSTGGLWVSEFEKQTPGECDENEDHELAPYELAHLRLARTMDERCQILQEHFSGQFYPSLEEYDGYGFLKTWDEQMKVSCLIRLVCPDLTRL